MKIARIEPSKHKKGRVLIFLDDGELLKVTENELLRFDLRVGDDLPEEAAQTLKAAAKDSQLKATAAAMVGKRLLSRKEVQDRLIKKGAEAAAAKETAQWLEELGAVDDAAYAGAIARHYAAAGYGALRVKQELQKRGISRELWEDALTELPAPTEAVERFVAAKMRNGDDRERKKIADALLRRGFTWNDIRPVLNRWGEEIEEEL